MSEAPRTLTEDWRNTREEILEEYDYECQHCGATESELRQKYGRGLSTHHLVPRRLFDDDSVADHPRNLFPICTECHGLWEAETRRVLAGANRTLDPDARDAVVEEYTALLGKPPGNIHRHRLTDYAVAAIREHAMV